IATLLVAGIAGGVTAGISAWRHFATHAETDDAYTTGHMHEVSARINDTVQQVLVDDNEHVKAGQVLVVLDPRDYQVRVQQALAALNTAKRQADAAKTAIALAATNASGKITEAHGHVSDATANIIRTQSAVTEAQTMIPQTQSLVKQREAQEWRAATDYKRFSILAQQGAVSLQQRDQAWQDWQVAKEATKAAQDELNQMYAKLSQAQQSVTQAQAQLVQSQGVVEQAKSLNVQTQVNAEQFDVAKASIDQAQAALADAQLQLSYTNVVSPVNGRVGKKQVEAGDRVQPGQQLMTVVSDDVWVVANFKETQLEQMRPGEAVAVNIDSFPSHKFIGRVDSVSPGSGATFALLPPDNAT
ncbi:MAG: HlyD family secretion protein, partial [Terriglobales bacterium]